MKIWLNSYRFKCLLLIVGLMLLACAAREPRGGEQQRPQEHDEAFDPFAYAGDADIVTSPTVGDTGRTADSSLYVISEQQESRFPSEVYRVQLYAGQNYYDAATERNLALEVFDEPVRINYVSPYYRVEAGNFPTQAEAEKFLQRAKSLGYGTSWVVSQAVDSLFWLQLEADTLAADTLNAPADSLRETTEDNN